MAPGTSGRPTGTVPKNKQKSSGSQSHRLTREPFIQSSLDWEPISDLKSKKSGYKSSAHSESEVSSIQVDLERFRSSTMTSQSENREGCTQNSLSNKINIPDRKQVVNKLSQIQSYLQQTADLMDTIKSSDSPAQRNQYNKLSIMLEELKDSEIKLRRLLNKMDNTESRIDSLLIDLLEEQPTIENGESRRMQKFNRIVNDNYGILMCLDNAENNNEVDEEISRKPDESKKKLEALQKRKQELLLLQEKAKKQLLEAQAEQSRLVARASSLNQELTASKPIDLNVQQLSQRLKAVQQIYNTKNHINDSLKDNRRTNIHEADHLEEDPCQENSDTETDFQLVADKMEELNVMKAQLGEIQKIMASINGMQNQESLSRLSEAKENTNFSNKSSFFTEEEARYDDPSSSNLMKLEQAKSKLNHLTQLLEIVQTAQNTAGLSPSYLQLVSNLAGEETGLSTPSQSLTGSVKSVPKNREDESMKIMTKELEETTAAMKEERDKLAAARQELQNIARRIPQKSAEGESLSPNDSESEPPCLKNISIDSNSRDILNGSDSVKAEQSPSCNEGSVYSYKTGTVPPKSNQREVWSTPSALPNATNQDRRFKNESFSRGSTHSSRVGSRCLGKDSRWSPSSSVTYDKSNPASQAQNQLELSGNLCEIMLSESLQQGTYPGEITLQEMFHQHQLLTRTVAQCSQLLWLQQKQIVELRNTLMLQTGAFSSLQAQQIVSSQSQVNIPNLNNSSYSVIQQASNLPNLNPVSTAPSHQHQNSFSFNQNQIKLNCREIQRAQIYQQEQFPEQFSQQASQSSIHFSTPDLLGYDTRLGNFTRLNPPFSNSNQNINQNIFSNSNNRIPHGLNALGPEDSGALNNQVPPGNRANNYWDNFRSYSRQNLLSTTKSNEETESSRRMFLGQERLSRDLVPPSQNNQIPAVTPQQIAINLGNPDTFSNDHHHHHHHPHQYHHHPPSQNTQANHHAQITRSRSVEPQSHRNTSKNETRHQDNDSRNFIVTNKNEGLSGARARNPDCLSENIRSVRNDVNQSLRNDNLNSSRNFDNEDNALGNSKKRLERSTCRKEGVGNLNNRSQCNRSLWENISSEVSNFIRTNETRPQFLIQLFRDLQQVTNDNLRQKTLESIQETVNANNLTERSSNTNTNIIENRNNIRENRSNINRNQAGQEDPTRIDELFYHLRENQNTIRQNIGMNAFVFGGNNLENPNISNIRDLVTTRNNLESEGLKDLRTYFEANLCSFGDNHSTLENPNLSNIRENLTRRVPGMLDHENVNPKNVYLSISDSVAVELRRRNQESTEAEESCRNFETGNDFGGVEYANANDSARVNNQFELGSSFDGVVGEKGHYHQGNTSSGTRYSVLDGGDNFLNSRQFLTNANDSGIDINYNSDDRKGFDEGKMATSTENSKFKKIEGIEIATLSHSQWERRGGRDTVINTINSSSPSLIPLPTSENSFFEYSTLQQSDNGDLAEADQSRNEETSNAESDSGFINSQIIERTSVLSNNQSQQNSENNFPSQNKPESERNFSNDQNYSLNRSNDAEGNSCFPKSVSEVEGNFSTSYESIQKSSDVFHCPVNSASTSSEVIYKSDADYKVKEEATEREKSDSDKGCSKNLSNKFRENFSGKCIGVTNLMYDNQSEDLDSENFFPEQQFTESRESLYATNFMHVFDSNTQTEIRNMSQEAESDWESGSGLDQVPTLLKKNGSKKSSDSSL